MYQNDTSSVIPDIKLEVYIVQKCIILKGRCYNWPLSIKKTNKYLKKNEYQIRLMPVSIRTWNVYKKKLCSYVSFIFLGFCKNDFWGTLY